MMNLQVLKKMLISQIQLIKAIWSEIEYPLSVTGGRNSYLEDYRIYGNTLMEGEPSTETPASIESVGELVTEGENAGKYKIPVLVRGKNLLNQEHFQNADNWIQLEESTYKGYKLNITKTGTYTLSMESLVSSDSSYWIRIRRYPKGTTSSGSLVSEITSGKLSAKKYTVTFQLVEGYDYYIWANFASFKTLPVHSNDNFTDWQLEEGEGTTEFEEYVEPKNVQIYLDEPLRKIIYKDKEYADSVDFEKGIVIKKTYEKVWNGTEAWSAVTSYPAYALRITPTSQSGICTHYQIGQLGTEKSIKLGFTSTVYVTDSSFATLDEFKAFLAEQAASGTPVKIVYFSRDAYLEDAEEVPVKLPRIPQFKGTTIYEIQTKVNPRGMEAYYYG